MAPTGKKGSWHGKGEELVWVDGLIFATEGHANTQKEGPERKESLDYVKNKERDRHSKPQSGGGWGNRTKWGAILLVRAECEVIGFDKATGPSKCRPKVV